MKYRMQENEHHAGHRLMRGNEIVPCRAMEKHIRDYHEAAVEFWREIELARAESAKWNTLWHETTVELERLRASNAELLAACKAAVRVVEKSGEWPRGWREPIAVAVLDVLQPVIELCSK